MLLSHTKITDLSTRPARILDRLQRSEKVVGRVMEGRQKFEDVISLSYWLDGGGTKTETGGGGPEGEALRVYALNLPYRYCRWLEAQATGEPIVVKAPRDAGAGQKKPVLDPATGESIPQPGDEQTAEWVERIITRALYEARYENEMNAVIGECCGRGISFLEIGYHEESLSRTIASEVGKDAQSVGGDVILKGETEAVPGQADAEIAEGLRTMAGDRVVQAQIGMQGVVGVLTRAGSHDAQAAQIEMDRSPIVEVRDIRRRIWVRKLRVNEDLFFDQSVADFQDVPLVARRHVNTKAEFDAKTWIKESAKKKIHGYPDRNQSGMTGTGQTDAARRMSPDARQVAIAAGEDTSEWLVEWFEVYEKRPNMAAGGVRYALCFEVPDEVISVDDTYPFVDDEGYCVIPGFYPFFDFTPLKPPVHQPERMLGIPLVAPGWTQFEKIQEFNRLRVESARKHSLRAYQFHPALKAEKKLQERFQNGEDGICYFAPAALMGPDGKMQEAVIPIQFSGNTQEIDKQAQREYADWIRVQGMPPAHVEGVGQAETATQEQIGTSAGESEMAALVKRLESRMADVCEGIRGLIRAFYDSEDIVELLGFEGGQAIKHWSKSSMKGDRLQVMFGLRARREDAVEKKQLMEAIQLVQTNIDPVTQLPVYDAQPLYAELFRSLGMGKPQMNQSMLAQLQQLALIGQQALAAAQAQQQAGGGGSQAPASGGQNPGQAPRPSEGSGPSRGNLESGARNGTVNRPAFAAAA